MAKEKGRRIALNPSLVKKSKTSETLSFHKPTEGESGWVGG